MFIFVLKASPSIHPLNLECGPTMKEKLLCFGQYNVGWLEKRRQVYLIFKVIRYDGAAVVVIVVSLLRISVGCKCLVGFCVCYRFLLLLLGREVSAVCNKYA